LTSNRFLTYPALVFLFLFCSGCGKQQSPATPHEQHTVGAAVDSVQIRSVDFYSAALQRTAHYLLTLPPEYDTKPASRFPVLFLLHGMDGRPADGRLGQSIRLLRVFGLPGGQARRSNDVFLLVQQMQTAPFIYLTCGTSEGLLGANRSFDALLTRQRLTHEYREEPGVHSWDSWDRMLPSMLTAAEEHLAKPQ